MGTIIGMLVGKSIFGKVIGEKGARAIAYAGLVVVVVLLLLAAKWAYDRSVIKDFTNEQAAKTAKADRKADNTAAVQRRIDDTRTASESQEIKEAINEAGPDPIARRRAYYECVRLQQAARREHKPSPKC